MYFWDSQVKSLQYPGWHNVGAFNGTTQRHMDMQHSVYLDVSFAPNRYIIFGAKKTEVFFCQKLHSKSVQILVEDKQNCQCNTAWDEWETTYTTQYHYSQWNLDNSTLHGGKGTRYIGRSWKFLQHRLQ